MTQKKVCMLGSFAVGKTSLVKQFVHSIFSEKYHTTVGVKIDKKELQVGQKNLTIILWDIHGDDEFQRVRDSYLRGASGYLLVVDGTRRETLDTALALSRNAQALLGPVPFVLVLNKTDLQEEWEVEETELKELEDEGMLLIWTSAKSGSGVETAFQTLAEKMLSE